VCDDDDDGNNCKHQKKWQPRLHESTETTCTHRQTQAALVNSYLTEYNCLFQNYNL